jgi:energy-coupling factor transport system substrate-specific component
MRLKLKGVQRTRQSLVQRLLQQQLQILSLKEALLMGGFIIGAAGLRAAMQFMPSVEPITFFAILSGWLLGGRKGFVVGASALYVSNFLCFGGQGPWTVFQGLAFGIAGYMGGFISKRLTYIESIIYMLGATIVFELILNVFSGVFFGGNILLAFFTGAIFAGIHLVSNLVFAFLLPAAGRQLAKGGFHEKGFLSRGARALAARAGINGWPVEEQQIEK